MQKPLGLGLVGAGAFGEFCLEAYTSMDEVKVVALADIDTQRAHAIAPRYAIVYTEYKDLLANPNVQIVAINTPPHLHASMIHQAATMGKHIYVEKPLAISIDEAKLAIQAVNDSNVYLGINYILRHHPLHKIAAQIILARVLGKFQHWSLENFATDEALHPDHWFWDKDMSGGIHIEHGVHFFDLCNCLAGEAPTEVIGFSQRRPDGRLDRVAATVQYGADVLATFYHSFNQIKDIERTSIRLNCSRGSIFIEGWIPTRLSVHGFVEESGLSTLFSLLGEDLKVLERFSEPKGTFQHGGVSEEVVALISGTLEIPDRQREYQRAIQAGMRNLVETILGEASLEVSIENGLLSLAVALAASDSERGGPFINPF